VIQGHYKFIEFTRVFFRQVLAIFVTIPPMIGVAGLSHRFKEWLVDLSWIRRCTGAFTITITRGNDFGPYTAHHHSRTLSETDLGREGTPSIGSMIAGDQSSVWRAPVAQPIPNMACLWCYLKKNVAYTYEFLSSARCVYRPL